LLGGRSSEHYSAIFQLLICTIDVIRHKRHIAKRTDPIFVTRTTLVSLPDTQFNPTLFVVKWLVGQDLKTELFRIETNCLVLISHWNAHKLYRLNHKHLLEDSL